MAPVISVFSDACGSIGSGTGSELLLQPTKAIERIKAPAAVKFFILDISFPMQKSPELISGLFGKRRIIVVGFNFCPAAWASA